MIREMKTKQRLYHTIPHGVKACCLALLTLVSACGGQDEPSVEKEDEPQLSDKEISLDVGGWKPMTESRAVVFENLDDLKDGAKGGGDFTLHAYIQESGQTFIDGTRVHYHKPIDGTTPSWEFYADGDIFHYYWPHQGKVDFFAYMPWNKSNKQNIQNISYSKDKDTGISFLSFSCQMQEETTDVNDASGQETVVAYVTDRDKSKGVVEMLFVHPYSAVYFELKQAHRDLTINWIRFNKVHLQGKTKLDATIDANTVIQWEPTGSTGTFTIPVGKTIPSEINFGAPIGGPYLVMPQAFSKGENNTTEDDVTITVNYTWDDGLDQDKTNDTKEFTLPIQTQSISEWTAGKKYTYVLSLGDNQEEILFQVKVDPWIWDGYKHEIDVE